jgi:hypothetical protein
MPLPYSALSPEQATSIEYLFCDAAFGSDPVAYLYEIDARGQVTGRSSIAGNGGTARKGGNRKVTGVDLTVRIDAHVTRDQLENARNQWDLYLDKLARRIVINCQQMAVSEISE